jgi:heat shock protein HslJ
MKHNAFFISALAAAAAMSSCSVLGLNKSTTTTGTDAQLVDAATATTTTTQAAATITTAEKDTIEPTATTIQPAVAEETSNLLTAIDGEWLIIQVGSTTIDRDEDMPYVNFDIESGLFYANNGCNTLNGSFSLSGELISFVNVLSTMKYCPDVQFDHEINTVIADGSSVPVKLSTVGQESFLDFYSNSGKTIMRLRRGNLDFLNGYWTVESISGIDSLDAPADIFFDLSELKLHGNTGCNYFNGSIYMDHRSANAIDFSNMGVTRMACPYTAQETAMLVALETTASAVSNGHDKVKLLDASGHQLMALRRAPMPSAAK